LGDFNLIYRACDKSNTRINRRLLQTCTSVLDELEVKEFHLHGRRFTWSRGTANPTQTKIDHVFSSREWELSHGDSHLQALGSSMSDHCPLLLTCSPSQRKYQGFRFEAYWLKFPEFHEQVVKSWTMPVSSGNKAHALHIKLARLAKDLKRWNRTRIAALKKKSADTQQLVMHIDQLQDQRPLTNAEIQERKQAKGKIWGLAAVRKIKLRQRSRLTWIKVGDENSKLFHLKANSGRRKNFIPTITHKGRLCTTHQAKTELLHNYYSDQLGPPAPKECTINWEAMHIQRQDLGELDMDITKAEVYAAIRDMPSEKSPRPYGFIGAFYKR
jgi:hypothetical protein